MTLCVGLSWHACTQAASDFSKIQSNESQPSSVFEDSRGPRTQMTGLEPK